MTPDIENGRPSKRPCLSPSSTTRRAVSPSSDAAFDDAFDDADDLYDTPVKSPSSSTAVNAPKSPTKSLDHHDKSAIISIPGLSLNGKTDAPASSSPSRNQTEVAMDAIEHTNIQEATYDINLALPKTEDAVSREESSKKKQPADEDFLPLAQEKNENKDAEWEYNSSDAQSDSSSEPESSDEEESEGKSLLEPAEQARILMQGVDSSSASDSDSPPGQEVRSPEPSSKPLRTANEKPDEIVEKPNVNIEADTQISELGIVDNIVENYVVIKAITSGESRILATGSVVCLEDKTLLGAISEPFGPVRAPHYSVAFTNAAEIEDAGVKKGNRVYYVCEHSEFVFTQALQLAKGSDASNIHDEEIGDDDVEFSDDEAEAEHKRKVKVERLEKKGLKVGSNLLPHPQFKRPRNEHFPEAQYPSQAIKYEDDEDDDLYTPLPRPSNLHQITSPPHQLRRDIRGSLNRGRAGRQFGDRGRGGRFNQRVPPASVTPNARRNRRDSQARDGQYIKSEQRGSLGGSQNGSNDRLFRNESGQSESQDRGTHPTDSSHPLPGPWPLQASHSYPQTAFPQSSSRPQNPYQMQQYGWPQNGYGYPPTPQGLSAHYPQSPLPMSPGGSIPPGAFVNPAFFQNQQQHVESPIPPFAYNPSSPGLPANFNQGRGSPESQAAFDAAQDRIRLLRELQSRSRSP